MRRTQRTPPGFLCGTVVDGRYRLEEEIGRGSIGRVYRAVQLRVNRDVAVKVLRRDFTIDDRMSARFEREARAVALLDHPNCLTLHDFGYDDQLEKLFMVTELLPGRTLRDQLPELGVHARLNVGYFIAEALKHAHEAGVVHRDLKPENVLVATDLDGRVRVKVVDFGLALLFERGNTSGEQRRLTMAGEIYGSPRYLSPEQCRGSLNVTAASDMYSFGVMLYELFEGHVPFDHRSLPAMLTAHVSDPPPPMLSFPLVDIEQLITELLAKDPAERPTSHEARDVFARNVDLSVSGMFDSPRGLAESTLGSEVSEATSEAPPAASRSAELATVIRTPEARVGAFVGAFVTLLVLLMIGVFWLLLR